MIPFILLLLASSLVLTFLILPILAIGICSLLVTASAFSFTGGLLLALINPRLLDDTPLLPFMAVSAMIGTSAYIPLATAGLGLAVGITLALCLIPVAATALSVGFLSLLCNNISLSFGSQPYRPHSSEFVCCSKHRREAPLFNHGGIGCSFFFNRPDRYDHGINHSNSFWD